MTLSALYVLLGFMAILPLDVPYLVKNKKKKELFIYFSILGLAFILSELHVMRIVTFDWVTLIGKFFHMFQNH